MTKELVIKNLKEALENIDYSFSDDDVQYMVDVAYNYMKDWTYGNFHDFVCDVADEFGDYLYAMRENGLLPDLIEDRKLVNDWFADHEQAMRDCLFFAELYPMKPEEEEELKGDGLYNMFCEIDSDNVVDWLTDEHEQAYKDCMLYIVQHK